jgi:hypothetical protein
VNVVRGFSGSKAQEFVNFLDQVSGLHARLSSFEGLQLEKQILTHLRLDDELWWGSLRLLSKICKARSIIPASYILQPELVRPGTIRCRGGFADVGDGKFKGLHVAIKHPRVNKEDSDRAFKVLPIVTVYHRCLFYVVVVPRGHYLETSVPSQYSTLVGDL